MDVTCASCGEPWDTYHLHHDAVHDTAAGIIWIDYKLDCEDFEKELGRLTPSMRSLCKGPKPPTIEGWKGRLTPFWREQFAACGWQFGSSVSAILRCPCCKKGEELKDADERIEARKIISELLDGDEDAIDVTLEDLAHTERI